MAKETAFANKDLSTNTYRTSIDLGQVIDAGQPKDGIPAIIEPKFGTIVDTEEWLDDDAMGILYTDDQVTRYYPYAILYWHEIVNDTLNDKNIVITFCPLCGTAIIYERGDDNFGVSGKLWESNLLMYDQKTESLWSQILGEAVVGDRLGEKLKMLNSTIISFADLKTNYPDAQILNRDTGHYREYGQSPYGDYEASDALYFPVSITDDAFSKKELFHIVNVDGKSIGFLRSALLETGEAVLTVNDQNVTAKFKEDGTVLVMNQGTQEIIPSYTAMWFAWVSQTNPERIIWSGPDPQSE